MQDSRTYLSSLMGLSMRGFCYDSVSYQILDFKFLTENEAVV